MTTARTRPGGDSSGLVRKLWQYCHVLRDDGLSYPDYVEQLTYLLFLKMSDEQDDGPVPPEFGWRSLAELDAEAMHQQYGRVLAALGERRGMLSLIFRNARNKIRDPAKLRLLVADLIGQTEWTGLSVDLKGDAYEGLLEKNARDTKSGAGQYFTPRPLIEAIVECVNPQIGEVVCDPACGTGGFLLAAHAHLSSRTAELSATERRRATSGQFRGVELVEEVARLAAMNLLLHGMSSAAGDELPITCLDSLKLPPSDQVDVVLTNPPFGVKGSVTYASSDGKAQRSVDELTVVRPDFWVRTANKQLNFVQHVYALLKPGGRAAVVVPDNVLFEGGAAASIRRRLLETCDVHTLLRLPTGLFYAHAVKANVLFFDRPATAVPIASERLWVYDFRSGIRFSLKTNPLQRDHLDEFVRLYSAGKREDRSTGPDAVSGASRWRSFDVEGLLKSPSCRLDLTWETEKQFGGNDALSRLDEISRLIAADLHRALEQIVDVGVRRQLER